MPKKRKLTLQQRRRIAEQRNSIETDTRSNHANSSLGDLRPGLIAAHYGTEVVVDDGQLQQRCFFRANLELAVGDNVQWRPSEDGLGVVESRGDRSTLIQRPDSYGALRTVGANISQMLITISPEPEPHSALIDRYLVSAEYHHIHALLLLNKCDLPGAAQLDELLSRYSQLGYDTLKVSAQTQAGLPELLRKLNAHTSIFVGQSGVGKSSLVQMLLPGENIRIGELSEAEAKGRHTTTHSQLYRFPSGGLCIDSPGIREFGLWHTQRSDVIHGFKEIFEYAQRCKFRDCSHNSEPGCAVLNAVDSGEIHPERFQSFQLILSQLDDVTIKTQDKLKKK